MVKNNNIALSFKLNSPQQLHSDANSGFLVICKHAAPHQNVIQLIPDAHWLGHACLFTHYARQTVL